MKHLYKIIYAFIALSFMLSNKAQAQTNYYLYLPKDNNMTLPTDPKGQKFAYNEDTKEYELNIESIQEDQVGIIYTENKVTWEYKENNNYHIIIGDFITLKKETSGNGHFIFPYYMKNITITIKEIESKDDIDLSMKVTGETIPFIFGKWNTKTDWNNNNDRNRLFLEENINGDWYGKLESDFSSGELKSFKFNYKSEVFGAPTPNNELINITNDDVHVAYKENNTQNKRGYFYYTYSEPVYIKFHLNNDGTCTFVCSKEPFYTEQLVWQDAEGKKIEPDEYGNYHHETTFGKDNNVVRLVNGNPYDYIINYREPNYTHPTDEISLLDLTEETPEIIRDEDGYRDATEKECSIVGSTINFNAAGNYKITHKTQKNAPTLYVTVAQAEAYIQVTELSEYFNPSSNQYTWGDAISFTNEQDSNSELIKNITTSDFNVSITPQNGESWVKLENYSAELSKNLSEENLYKAAYEAALIGDIYNQYKELVSQRLADQSNVYIDVYIDGFFSDLTEPKVTEVSEGSGHFSLTQIFPCSGVYDVTISPNPQGNFIFENKKTTITIIPNLYGMFGEIPGFNINGYGFTVENPEKIQYPTNDATEDNLKNSVAYKPGTYFDSGFSIVVNETTYSGVSATMNENVAQNTNWINFDFSALVTPPSIGVKATVMKNGAKGEYDFTVDKNEEIPTAVENIEAGEKGDAVYYNLQGVPVLNPGHGVYIRIINGKAEKIVM